jgi:hypothetical protein
MQRVAREEKKRNKAFQKYTPGERLQVPKTNKCNRKRGGPPKK